MKCREYNQTSALLPSRYVTHRTPLRLLRAQTARELFATVLQVRGVARHFSNKISKLCKTGYINYAEQMCNIVASQKMRTQLLVINEGQEVCLQVRWT